MMANRIRSGLVLLVLIAAAGCGDSQTPKTDGAGKADALPGKLDAGPKTDALREAAVADAAVGPSLEIDYQSKATFEALSKVTPVVIDGANYARLSDLVALALPGKGLDTLVADFEGSDGFKPANSGSGLCKPIIPIPGANLAKGFVHVTSRNLRWDDTLAYPGCMSIKDLAKVLLSDK